jgi:hypothetical protein
LSTKLILAHTKQALVQVGAEVRVVDALSVPQTPFSSLPVSFGIVFSGNTGVVSMIFHANAFPFVVSVSALNANNS